MISSTTQPSSSLQESQQFTPLQTKLSKLMFDLYKVKVNKFDAYHIDTLTTTAIQKKPFVKGGGDHAVDIDEAKLKQRVNQTPIEELGFDQTAMDENVIHNVLKHPLLIEIKELRNVSQPFQRTGEKSHKGDDEEHEKKRLRKLKNQTYMLKAHDGKRMIKIIMLFQDQAQIVKNLYESNKYCLYDAYLSPAEPNTFIVDYPEQIAQMYVDKRSPKLEEEFQMIQGLPIKYTSAPRFVFLNEQALEEGVKQEVEQDDEFADLFKHFDVPDLTSSERTFIKRFEQIGFWRKKFVEKANDQTVEVQQVEKAKEKQQK